MDVFTESSEGRGGSDITVSLLLTVAVGGVGGGGLPGQGLAPAQKLVLDHRPLLVQDPPQDPSVVLE